MSLLIADYAMSVTDVLDGVAFLLLIIDVLSGILFGFSVCSRLSPVTPCTCAVETGDVETKKV